MLKGCLVAALLAAQIGTAPALAADLVRETEMNAPQRGAFAGVRLRVPLGTTRETPRAGLALATLQRERNTGQLSFSRGVELGLAGSRPSLAIGGREVRSLVPGRDGPRGERMGISPVGWIAIGAGVVLIAAAVWYVDAGNRATE